MRWKMIDQKRLRASIMAVIKTNHEQCSICIQNIDSNVMAFANMRDIKVSWGREEITLFIPHEITFRIPCMEIKEYTEFPERKQIEIVLEGRILFSIRSLVL